MLQIKTKLFKLENNIIICDHIEDIHEEYGMLLYIVNKHLFTESELLRVYSLSLKELRETDEYKNYCK